MKSDSDEVPEPVRDLKRALRIMVFQHFPSLRELAKGAGLSPDTTSRAVNGSGLPTPETLDKILAACGKPHLGDGRYDYNWLKLYGAASGSMQARARRRNRGRPATATTKAADAAAKIVDPLGSGPPGTTAQHSSDGHDDKGKARQDTRWTSVSIPVTDVGTNHPWTVQFSRHGRLMAIGGGNGLVRVWDSNTGHAIGEPLTGHVTGVSALAFSWDAQRLATGGTDGTVRLWNPATGRPVGESLASNTSGVTAMSFSQKGLLAIGYEEDVVRWDPNTSRCIGGPLTGHTGRVLAVAFSPDGQLLATGSSNGTVRLWNPATGLPTTEPMIGHSGPVLAMAFSPDGQRLAAAGGVTVWLWNPVTGLSTTGPMIDNTGPVYAVAFSPNGELLATGGSNKTVRLWNTGTGRPASEPLTDMTGYGVLALAFSSEGRWLASVSDDGTLRRSRRVTNVDPDVAT
jgi:WD40 repeat protein/transcriptional regulator with XRE-family HTH domain